MLRHQLDDVSVMCITRDFKHDLISWIHPSALNKHHKIAFCRFKVNWNAWKNAWTCMKRNLTQKTMNAMWRNGIVCNSNILMDLFPICRRYPLFPFLLLFSHDLEVTESVLQQRITHIECEYHQKYNDAKEQLKNDKRLTVDVIVQHDGKGANEWERKEKKTAHRIWIFCNLPFCLYLHNFYLNIFVSFVFLNCSFLSFFWKKYFSSMSQFLCAKISLFVFNFISFLLCVSVFNRYFL